MRLSKQQLKPKAITFFALLLGMALLLSGCVAPDGTILRWQTAPDGAIVGIQSEAPPEIPATAGGAQSTLPAASFPPRPILYLDIQPETAIRAIESDGTLVSSSESGSLLGWSPQGDRFAYLPGDINEALSNFPANNGLTVTALDDVGKVNFDLSIAGEEVTVLNKFQPSVWSPDGTQIALLLMTNAGVQAVVINATSGEMTNEHTLPEDATALDFLGLDFPTFPTISWSPTGDKLLVALGGELIIIDRQSALTETFVISGSPMQLPNQVEWLPSGDGVIYLGLSDAEGADGGLPQLWRQMLGKAEPELLLSGGQLSQLLGGDDPTTIKLSPTRRYLSVVGTNFDVNDSFPSSLVVLNLAALQSAAAGVAAPQPLGAWQLPGLVTAVQWSPDEQEFAFISVKEGITLQLLPWAEATSHPIAEIVTWANEDVEWTPYGSILIFGQVSWIP